ncbi:hypothetical protein MKK75_28835 [Methylobacterium sp. J-030]|nr:hypothetical protein [Methylobacterium sp. J-030]MCJ2072752.1 hypothetical protein [Methylobacterium sp. J-030]
MRRALGTQAVRTAVPKQDGEHQGRHVGMAGQVLLTGLETLRHPGDAKA